MHPTYDWLKSPCVSLHWIFLDFQTQFPQKNNRGFSSIKASIGPVLFESHWIQQIHFFFIASERWYLAKIKNYDM